MAKYLGYDAQISVQRTIKARASEAANIPILANGGRILSILDIDRCGWDKICQDIEKLGLVSLIRIDRDTTMARAQTELGDGFYYPYWRAFTGPAADIITASNAVVKSGPLPAGWTIHSYEKPSEDIIDATQYLRLITGVSPAPTSYIHGEITAGTVTCLWDANDALAACASGNMRDHPDGPFGGSFFASSISISPDHG